MPRHAGPPRLSRLPPRRQPRRLGRVSCPATASRFCWSHRHARIGRRDLRQAGRSSRSKLMTSRRAGTRNTARSVGPDRARAWCSKAAPARSTWRGAGAGLLAFGAAGPARGWTEDEQLAAGEMLRVSTAGCSPCVSCSASGRSACRRRSQRLPTGCAGDLPPNAGTSGAASPTCTAITARQHFHKLVGHRPAVLLLLDGLDEVTDPARPRRRCSRGCAISARHLSQSCRRRHQPQAPMPPCSARAEVLDWPAATLDKPARGHRPLCGTLARGWSYYEWGAAVGERIDAPFPALAVPAAELLEIAGTPLLLTMMVGSTTRSAAARQRTHRTFVKRLLFEWERRRQRGAMRSLLSTACSKRPTHSSGLVCHHLNAIPGPRQQPRFGGHPARPKRGERS